MATSRVTRIAVFVLLFGITGCTGVGAPGTPALRAVDSAERSTPESTAKPKYRLLYSFGAEPDGQGPVASLIDVDGELYGTTSGGGQNTGCSSGGCGTVFKIGKTGSEKVVYRFSGGSDAAKPLGSIVDVDGTLYGTSSRGGSVGQGAIFSITGGKESVLHSFHGGDHKGDGAYPTAGLVNVDGVLYGSSTMGGTNGSSLGAIFKYDIATGAESGIFSFQGTNGTYPQGNLLYVNGVLYGTTLSGGSSNDGTVFGISTAGKLVMSHSFTGSNGADPTAGLIDLDGELYGTTSEDGACCGTAFEISKTGNESVIYNFAEGSGGYQPLSGLTSISNELYGTTHSGGGVYALSTSGKENLVYAFKGGTDGYLPIGGLLNVDGVLYGTTSQGGKNDVGTVFSLTP